jgi:monothiol glutaredoxin
METIDKIKQQIADNSIILYMKGSPSLPQCGFSARVVQILQTFGKDFAYVDVLANPDVRQQLPQVANWPTFPQLFVNGELVGGCDIVTELYENGQLQQIIESATVNS